MAYEVLAMTYDIWISGTKLSQEKKSCITSIEIKETVEGSDVCTIKISDPEFTYLEDNIFINDNTIKVRLGWSDVNYRVEFKGYISAIDVVFPEDGVPVLTVTCMDNTHLMNRKKKNKTFKKTTNASVVKQIVKSYGYKCVVESDYKFTTHETITQSDQTDIDFITKLAGDEVYPFTARLVGDTFYYVKKGKLTEPKMELSYLKYPHEIISFSPKITKESSQVEIKSSTVKSSNKKISTSATKKSSITSESKTSKGGSASSGSNSSSSKSNSSKTYTYNPKNGKWS